MSVVHYCKISIHSNLSLSIIRWWHSLQVKAMSYVLVAILCFYLFSYDAMVGLIFTKSSLTDVFAVLFINGGTPMKIAPPPRKKWGEMRRNPRKTKTTGITTIRRLCSHLRLVKFSSGAFELQATRKLCILANGPWRCLTKPWNVMEWLYQFIINNL